MPNTLAVDRRHAPSFLPLLPGDEYLLRHGHPHTQGADTGRANRRGVDTDGVPLGWSGTYAFQSDVQLVRALIYRAQSQGVWSDEEILDALLDPANIGGAWLRCQDDPKDVFTDLLADCYVPRAPRHSAGQAAALVLQLPAGEHGASLADLQRAIRLGKRSRGNVEQLARWMVARQYLREVRTYGPTGKVASRRFHRTRRGTDYKIVSAFTRAVSKALHGLEALGRALGHKSPQGRADSATKTKTMLEDVAVMNTGAAKLKWIKVGKTREAGRRRGHREEARIEGERLVESQEAPAATALRQEAELREFGSFLAHLLADHPDAHDVDAQGIDAGHRAQELTPPSTTSGRAQEGPRWAMVSA